MSRDKARIAAAAEATAQELRRTTMLFPVSTQECLGIIAEAFEVSESEATRRAIRFLAEAVEHRQDGGEVVFRYPNGTEHTIMFV